MRRVFTARHPTEAHMVKDLLFQKGIRTTIRGESLFGIRGEVPVTEDSLPSLWVEDDADFEAAMAFVSEFTAGGEEPSAPSWSCVACGESVEGQFGVCWNCGAAPGVERSEPSD